MAIKRYSDSDILKKNKYDLVIIGAGTIGLYLAHIINLKNPSLEMCLVESGSEYPVINSNSVSSESKGKEHLGTLNGRASGIGGTSCLWGGQLAEFERSDFEREASKWPISYDEILSYYQKVYKRLGMKNVQSDVDYDQIYGALQDNMINRVYTRWLKEPNFYNFFKKSVLENKKITILTNTSAHNIKFIEKKAVSIECIAESHGAVSIAADKFIFASGTIGINQFFLSTQYAGIVPWKNNNNVGKYFQDHLGGVIGTLDIKDKELFQKYFENSWVKGIKIQPKLKLSSANILSKKNGVVVFFTYRSQYEDSIVRLKLSIKNIFKGFRKIDISQSFKDLYFIRRDLASIIYKFLFKKRIHAIFDIKDSIQVNVQSEQIPLRKSEIKINRNHKLESGLFKVDVFWYCSGDEAISIKKTSAEVNLFLKNNGIGEINYKTNFLQMSNNELTECLYDTYHQCGGMVMSTLVDTGVVDKNCKVWETENVWIAGSAVFPSSSHANSTLTALALAERMVEKVFE